MKKFTGIFTALLAMVTLSLSAQTADEIVNKNMEAMGGVAKLATLKTLKMTGSMSVQGMDVAVVTTKSDKVGWRLDLDVQGTANYRFVNKDKGYIFMAVFGMSEPQEMDAETYKSDASQLDINGALYKYKEHGNTVEYIGKETVDGADTYKLKVTRKNGKSATYFIDSKTNRLVKTVGMVVLNGEEVESTTTYADYKQNADGYWFAYTIINANGTVDIDKIETNIPVDEAIFKN